MAVLMIAAKPTTGTFLIDAVFILEEADEGSLEIENADIEFESPRENRDLTHDIVTTVIHELTVIPEVDLGVPSFPVVQRPADSNGVNSGSEGGVTQGGNGAGSGQGIGDAEGTGSASFFGKAVQADSVAFVIDASSSMTGIRFQRARTELMNSLSQLKPNQRFFVVFYTNRTFPLFYPRNRIDLVPADEKTLQKVFAWIERSQAQGGTQPQAAMSMTLKLKPDVVFFLSDGQIPIETGDIVRKLNRGSVIHAITFGSDTGDTTMRQIAEENSGTYRFIPDQF